MEYVWSKDEVQTARILFYMRVMPTCIERITATVFSRVVAPIMFLYMGHPNEEVARASHSMFVGFISSGKESDHDNRVSSKEQLVFYYIKRSLEGYPGSTPFKGMASGVAALVRHLPAGSPATFYCINSLVEKANELCNEAFTHEADVWKNWQGESEPCKEIFELLLRLISLIDRQVLQNLKKLLAQRKPTLVSWLQSLSYLCSQANSRGANFTGVGSAKDLASALTTDSLNLNATSSSFGFAGNPGFSSSSSPFGSSISAAKPFSSAPTFRLNTGTSLSEANSISSGSGTTPSVFGSRWQAPKSPSLFGPTFSSTTPTFQFTAATSSVATNSAPVFGSSTGGSSSSIFPFTSTAAATAYQPVFGNVNSVIPSGSAPSNNNDQINMEDSMAKDTIPSSTPIVPVFGQSIAPASGYGFGSAAPSSPFQFSRQQNLAGPQNSSLFQSSTPTVLVFGQSIAPASGYGFGSAAPSSPFQLSRQQNLAGPQNSSLFQSSTPTVPVFGQSIALASGYGFGSAAPSSPFQFSSQQNLAGPQNSSLFQASHSSEFNAAAAGGSSSLGTGGGAKSQRKIVKVKGKWRRK
ncbi:hypothetical protein ACOSQ4_033404 [Xanthoceras sorbifolium]